MFAWRDASGLSAESSISVAANPAYKSTAYPRRARAPNSIRYGKGRQAGGDRHLGLDLDDLDPVKRNRPHLRDHTRTVLQAMVEFSRIGSTTPAQPRRLDEKA